MAVYTAIALSIVKNLYGAVGEEIIACGVRQQPGLGMPGHFA